MKFDTRTRNLTLSYLGVIMLLSLVFSAIIYMLTVAQLNKPLPPREESSTVTAETQAALDERMARRDAETRQSILISLAGLNAAMLVGGTAASYLLARRTLRPIEASFAQQSRFVSDASHELRTPLTALLTTNEVALRKKQLDDQKMRQVLAKNVKEIEKLRDLSNTLLGLAAAETKKEQSKKIWLDDFINGTIEPLKPIADHKKITIKPNVEHVEIAAPSAALGQVLTILIDNAIKYSPENSDVEVKATRSNKAAIITVADHGIGISAAEQVKVFDRFYRADNARTRSDVSGHGLGLAIAKKLAETYGWGITVESKPGAGARFSLHLPS